METDKGNVTKKTNKKESWEKETKNKNKILYGPGQVANLLGPKTWSEEVQHVRVHEIGLRKKNMHMDRRFELLLAAYMNRMISIHDTIH